MHIIIIVGLLLIIVMLLLRQQKPVYPYQDESTASVVSTPGTESNRDFVFISKGKLFMRTKANAVEQIHSEYVQEMVDRINRRKQIHGWKENTSLSTNFNGNNKLQAGDQVDLQVVSAQFIDDEHIIYFMKDRNVGGLFEYDMNTKKERRLLHKQNLFYENLCIDSNSHRILCSQHHENGTANIVMISEEGHETNQLTEGDTVDAAPAWIPDNENSILYQSSGLARSEEGYVIAHGPSSILMLDMQNNATSTVLENAMTDFLQPKVDSQGNLYFIRRPYEIPRYTGSNALLDTLLFPFRLLRAIFHYLNFFSLMYSRKPLTSASGPKVEADIKELLIKGKRINAEKALNKESRINGIPSMVPKTWQLVRRTQHGAETVLATNVASYDLTSNDEILYSNGYAVFHLSPSNQTSVILRDTFVADVIAQ